MPYIGSTHKDREAMLARIGAGSIDELFSDIPAQFRFPQMDLPAALSELEMRSEAAAAAALNHGAGMLSFAGAGAYHHFIPSVVSYLSGRGEFATAYTPYQAEASQGTLQTIFEYQTMLCDLLDMDVVNASHYDGATAMAEAALMAVRCARGRSKVVFGNGIHPHYLDVAKQYLEPQGLTMAGGHPAAPTPSRSAAPTPAPVDLSLVDVDTAAVVVSNPDFFGRMHDLSGLAEQVHAAGALLVIHADPIASALFRSPGSLGADIVTGEGQPLGIPVSFGGPYLGIFAAKKELVRKLPGRLVGQTTDREGNRGFVLTLNTREQHIRREKATSNICTNQGLMALRAAIYLAWMGPRGLRETANLCYQNANYAAGQLGSLPGCGVNEDSPDSVIFRECVLKVPMNAEELVSRAADQGILPGVPLSRFFPDRPNELLVAVTETSNRARIDSLVSVVREITEAADG